MDHREDLIVTFTAGPEEAPSKAPLAARAGSEDRNPDGVRSPRRPPEVPTEPALSETSMAEQEEAPAEAQPAARAGNPHARRRAARAGRLPPAAELAAATDTTEQATSEGARRSTAGVVQGDTLSPGEWAATEGGGGGGNGLGLTGLSFFLHSYRTSSPCVALSSHLPTARHSPPGLAAGRHGPGPDGLDLAAASAASGPAGAWRPQLNAAQLQPN